MTSPLRTRVLILAALLAVAFGAVVSKLATLQIVRRAELAGLAERQYSRTISLQALRGPIVDRRGAPLAMSAATESLFAQPRAVGDPVRAAARLAPVLGMPEAEVHALLTVPKTFVWLKRRLPPAVADQVRALREPGLGFVADALRLYPNRELAAHVIGFEGADGGLEGVERAWDKDLGGTPGRAVVGRDALGREVVTQQVIQKPSPGHGVMLTLDTTMQYIAEREIDAAYRRTGSKAAMAVVMDPKTGDVLAVAIRPTFNPNTFAEARQDEIRNRAVTDPFEPGSTFKIIMAAAALEEGVVKPDDRIFGENGSITIARTTIRDWKKQGWMTFAEVLQQSSNVGSIKVGMAIGKETYHRYMTGFGFGAVTGVGLAGESRGLLREPGRWSALSLPTMSIGQEISVTALQMVSAFSAIANGGVLMQPRLVRATFDAEGRQTAAIGPRALRRVISEPTARTLMRLMVQIVDHGTGHAAAIAGYEVGGKTGTAQKMDPATKRYSHAPGVLSFIGVAPADDPRFVMLVMLDEPKNEKWGSEAAAPIFSSIGREILRYLEVAPRDAQPVQLTESLGGAMRAPQAPPLRAQTESVPPASPDPGVMPDVRGKPLRQALATLAALRADVELEGHGLVVQQVPAAGAPLAADAPIRLTLARGGSSEASHASGRAGAFEWSEARERAGASAPGARESR
ncbi:MAG: penicillin-binding protein 2 [Candidatus Rokubacteria bacterium]|nr:penicillin-binding protein 2 [Candidatus Rokubacteria bacterium]